MVFRLSRKARLRYVPIQPLAHKTDSRWFSRSCVHCQTVGAVASYCNRMTTTASAITNISQSFCQSFLPCYYTTTVTAPKSVSSIGKTASEFSTIGYAALGSIIAAMTAIGSIYLAILVSNEDESFRTLDSNIKSKQQPSNVLLNNYSTISTNIPSEEESTRNIEDDYEVKWDDDDAATKSQLLGVGNYGKVFVGYKKSINHHHNEKEQHHRRVAIKRILKQKCDTVTAFQNEVNALVHIHKTVSAGHPNICGLHQYYAPSKIKTDNSRNSKYYYLVLDYIGGGELFEALVNHGPYTERDAARVIRDIASALAFLHGINTVHCDLKPENLLLSTTSNPSTRTNPAYSSSNNTMSNAVIKLVDFGCARIIPNSFATSTNNGIPSARTSTLAYTPPEVLLSDMLGSNDDCIVNDDNATHRCRVHSSIDMWSLGVILYILLTGVHPFDVNGNSTDDEIRTAILTGDMPPLRGSTSDHGHMLTSHLSDAAIATLEKLLRYDAAERASAQDLLLHDPWVRGDAAKDSKIANIDKRLQSYRKYQSKLEAQVFSDLVASSSLKEHRAHAAASSRIGSLATKSTKLSLSSKSLDVQSKEQKKTVIERAFKNYLLSSFHEVNTDDSASDGSNGTKSLSLSGFEDLLSDHMKNQYFSKGEVIYKEGEPGGVMYFLNSGAIEVYTEAGFRKRVRRSGDFFGEGALLSKDGHRAASVRCLTPVHAIAISRECFKKYIANNEQVHLDLAATDKNRKLHRAETSLQLGRSIETRCVKKNEFIFRENDVGRELYILEKGKVKNSVDGNCVFHAKPGEMFGEHSLLFNRPRNVSAQCVSENCVLQVIDGREFRKVLRAQPFMEESVKDVAYRRDFQKAVCTLTGQPFPQNEKQLREAFDAVDWNSSGSLELRNIRRTIKRYDPTFSESDVKNILGSLDLDASGKVSWAEFKRIFDIV